MNKACFVILVLMMTTCKIVFADHDEVRNNLVDIIDEVVPIYGPPKNTKEIGEVFDVQEGEYLEFERTLYGGVVYYIIGAGDRNAKDVILAVFDENWNLLAKDIRSEPKAVIKFQPAWTGPFYFRLALNEAEGTGAGIGYVIVWGGVR